MFRKQLAALQARASPFCGPRSVPATSTPSGQCQAPRWNTWRPPWKSSLQRRPWQRTPPHLPHPAGGCQRTAAPGPWATAAPGRTGSSSRQPGGRSRSRWTQCCCPRSARRNGAAPVPALAGLACAERCPLSGCSARGMGPGAWTPSHRGSGWFSCPTGSKIAWEAAPEGRNRRSERATCSPLLGPHLRPLPRTQPCDETPRPGSRSGSAWGVLWPRGCGRWLCPRRAPVRGTGAAGACPGRKGPAGPGQPWAGDTARPCTPAAGCSPPACCPPRGFYCSRWTGGAERRSRDSWHQRGRRLPMLAPAPAQRRAGGRQTSFWSGAGRRGMLRAWNAPAQRRTSPPRRSSGAGYPVWAQRREPRWHGRGPGRHRPGAAPPPEQGQRVGAETPSQAGGQSRASSEPTEPRVWLGLQLSSASWGHDGKTPPPPKPWHYLDAEGKYLLGDICQEVRGGATLPLVIAGCVVLPARPRTWVGAWPVVCRAPTGHCPLHSPPIPLEGQAFHLRLPPMLQQLPLCPPAAARGGEVWAASAAPALGISASQGKQGDAARPRQQSLQEKQLLGIIPSHPARSNIKGRLWAIPTPFLASSVRFSPGTLPVAKTGALAAQKGFGLWLGLFRQPEEGMVLHARLPESLAGIPARHGELQRVLAQRLYNRRQASRHQGHGARLCRSPSWPHKGSHWSAAATASGDTGWHVPCLREGGRRITHEQQKWILFNVGTLRGWSCVHSCLLLSLAAACSVVLTEMFAWSLMRKCFLLKLSLRILDQLNVLIFVLPCKDGHGGYSKMGQVRIAEIRRAKSWACRTLHKTPTRLPLLPRSGEGVPGFGGCPSVDPKSGNWGSGLNSAYWSYL